MKQSTKKKIAYGAGGTALAAGAIIGGRRIYKARRFASQTKKAIARMNAEDVLRKQQQAMYGPIWDKYKYSRQYPAIYPPAKKKWFKRKKRV